MTVIFISRGGKQLGEFNEQEVSEGLKSGRFFVDDLAWKQGMADWKPLGTFPEFGGAPLSDTDPMHPSPQGAFVSRAASGTVDIGLCFSRAWESYKANFGPCLLPALVFIAASIVLQIPSALIQLGLDSVKGRTDMVPLLLTGLILNAFFTLLASAASMILTGGLMYFYINTVRSAPKFMDLFAGFRPPNWWRIFLAGIVWTLAMAVTALLVVVPGVVLSISMKNQTILIAMAVIFAAVFVYLSVAVTYAFPLIIDRKLGALDGLRTSIKTVHRQWWQVFVLFLILGLLMIAGILVCCVGVIFALPLGYLVLAEGYRQLFGDPGTER